MWQDTIKRQFKHKAVKDEILIKDCPYCGSTKYNLQVSISKGVFHCWVCDSRGSVERFFRDQKLEFDNTSWQSSAVVAPAAAEGLDLSAFVPVSFNKHKGFLSSRGLTEDDVRTYGMLTALNGRYKDKLIIPLKEDREVVYFVSRDMFARGKYCNPVIDKKSILPYYLGNTHRMRLYLVEGAFDAISVHKLGFTVAPLLGSSISNDQINKIKRIGFKEVVVCMDGDLKQKATEIYGRIRKAGISTKIILIPGKDDPNELYLADKEYLLKLLNTPREVTARDRMELALNVRS